MVVTGCYVFNAQCFKYLVKHLRLEIGRPNIEKNFTRALVMTGDVIFRSGMASGNLIEAHITVNRK